MIRNAPSVKHKPSRKGHPKKRRTPVLTAQDVAEYFLTIIDRENAGDTLTNLKIQKLLYYAQGFSLAINHRPLFNEKIIKWNLGPVVVEVYEHFRKYGADSIPAPDDFDISKFDDDEKELLNEVFEVYGQFSAAALVNMTHEEAPWRMTRDKAEIEHKRLQNFFTSRLRDHE